MFQQFQLYDYIAVGWFFICWFGYTMLADHSPLSKHSMSAVMRDYRQRWMRTSLQRREQRVVDSNLLINLSRAVVFFASTTILVVGGLIAMLGASDRALQVMHDLPIAVNVSRMVWEVKVLFMLLVFIYAFFKFAWALRLFNFCTVLVGALPSITDASAEDEAIAERAGHVNSLAAEQFNLGIRAYYFALAALSWFMHPLLFIATTTMVMLIIYRREFHSRSYGILKGKN